MGYFSNYEQARRYEEMYCDKCVHMHEEYDCPCRSAHMLWNYDFCNDKDNLLHKMIPRDKDGLNEQCIFFIAKE